MNAWELPTSLTIGGVGFSIRSDFRAALDIMRIYNDPELEDDDKAICCIKILYPDWKKIPQENLGEALQKAIEFLDAGKEPKKSGGRSTPKMMDWDQDAHMIIPAINKVVGTEVRSLSYLHWWTFVGAYMEIGESLFSTVISIRNKKVKGEKLDDYDKKFYAENKDIVDLKRKESPEEIAQKERLLALLQ